MKITAMKHNINLHITERKFSQIYDIEISVAQIFDNMWLDHEPIEYEEICTYNSLNNNKINTIVKRHSIDWKPKRKYKSYMFPTIRGIIAHS